jgi:hypothetical protein
MDLEAGSMRKKMKDKAFARAVNLRHRRGRKPSASI